MTGKLLILVVLGFSTCSALQCYSCETHTQNGGIWQTDCADENHLDKYLETCDDSDCWKFQFKGKVTSETNELRYENVVARGCGNGLEGGYRHMPGFYGIPWQCNSDGCFGKESCKTDKCNGGLVQRQCYVCNTLKGDRDCAVKHKLDQYLEYCPLTASYCTSIHFEGKVTTVTERNFANAYQNVVIRGCTSGKEADAEWQCYKQYVNGEEFEGCESYSRGSCKKDKCNSGNGLHIINHTMVIISVSVVYFLISAIMG